ncbi:MAG: Nedd8-like ubiquitin protein [Amphiamblys sp. WSBS2006]|nr:MAG: Nedd8-like ubiquitin protein [Amphiamblys sp. WSBS2006]
MLIKVRTLTGAENEINIGADEKAEKIKRLVEDTDGIPMAQQRLLHNGRQVQDSKTLREIGVESGAVLHLVIALRGG